MCGESHWLKIEISRFSGAMSLSAGRILTATSR
eukprot:CAMPEP_0177748986 /NCGR_PEP_ID=MMETSP0484_2-20121128/32236_1 /TAXON_ID=354590 /ORGANISM="Rhodomonas lens, Strain RHODO" /LENGTH=32 /DNA_ID= /DNA_START= /DNA_END= /DNA_ORIENTATION=